MDAAIHSPILVNGLGHLAGLIAFAAFLVLLDRGARLSDRPRLSPAAAAAGLALLWNLGSLIVLLSDSDSRSRELVASFSLAVLSLLPGVLLHLALGPRYPWLRRAGYATGSAAALLHVVEALGGAEGLHQTAIDLITYGFGGLAVVFVLASARGQGDGRGTAMRAAVAMSLFLLAASFVHFEAEPGPASWTHELIFHHAAIPLALFVLLQDHRFLLLDAFVRWLGAALLAGTFAGLLVGAATTLGWLQVDAIGPAGLAALIVGVSAAILVYPRVRDGLGGRVESALFPRGDLNATLERIRTLGDDESPFVVQAGEIIGDFVAAKRWALSDEEQSVSGQAVEALGERGSGRRAAPSWAEVRVALQTPSGRSRIVWLGPREGGRRYLGADLEDLNRLVVESAARLDVLRRQEQRRLLGEAELQALRAQINPHFLFNAFNALYGAIPRSVTGARRTLLNLTEILRYSLDGQRQYVALEEELRVVEAYLAIERLRLEERLSVRIDCDDAARGARIPAFTIQPLVENAVKHGISEKPEGGEITVTVGFEGDGLSVTVSDDGVGFDAGVGSESGHGLRNVRRRLELCYGEAARFTIESSSEGTRAAFQAPTATGRA